MSPKSICNVFRLHVCWLLWPKCVFVVLPGWVANSQELNNRVLFASCGAKHSADKRAALAQHDPCRDKITPLLFWGGVAGLVGSAEFTQICTTGVLSQLLLPKEDTDKQAALVQHDPCRDKITPLLFWWGVAGVVGRAEFTQICTTNVLSQLLLPRDTDKQPSCSTIHVGTELPHYFLGGVAGPRRSAT